MSTVKLGDTHTITFTLKDSAGAVVDLTGSTPRVIARALGGGAAVVLVSALGVDPGTVTHTLTGTLAAGTYHIEVEITASGGAITTAPSAGYATLTVAPDLD